MRKETKEALKQFIVSVTSVIENIDAELLGEITTWQLKEATETLMEELDNE